VLDVLPGAVRVGELDGAFAVAADRFRRALEHFADEAHGLRGCGVGSIFRMGTAEKGRGSLFPPRGGNTGLALLRGSDQVDQFPAQESV